MAYITVTHSEEDKGLRARASKHQKSETADVWLDGPSHSFSIALHIDEAEKLLADLPGAIAEAKRLQDEAAA